LAVIVFWVAVAVIVPDGRAGTTETACDSPVTDGLPSVAARTW